MRAFNRRNGRRLTMAFAAALLAGLLTAWAEPERSGSTTLRREIVEMTQGARDYLRPAIVVDQALPVARTIVSNSQ